MTTSYQSTRPVLSPREAPCTAADNDDAIMTFLWRFGDGSDGGDGGCEIGRGWDPASDPTAARLMRTLRLTRTELRVALLLARDLPNRDIAHALGISEHTARRHTERVLLKLNVHRRALVRERIRAALGMGG